MLHSNTAGIVSDHFCCDLSLYTGGSRHIWSWRRKKPHIIHPVWTHKDQKAWDNLDGCCSKGSHQSPIAINTKQVVKNPNLIPLQLNNWDFPVNGDIKNNGFTLIFFPHKSSKPATFKNHLGTYVLQQFHLHWGRGPGEGSEHVIDKKRFDAEIHFVHIKEGTDIKHLQPDSFAVLGVLCEKDYSGTLLGSWRNIAVPTGYDIEVPVTGIEYKDFLPMSRDYYHYSGSLTMPPCSEAVQWFILKDVVKIPVQVLRKLRQIEDGTGDTLQCNIRRLQPLNDRQIEVM